MNIFGKKPVRRSPLEPTRSGVAACIEIACVALPYDAIMLKSENYRKFFIDFFNNLFILCHII